jgi:hypothetical protein
LCLASIKVLQQTGDKVATVYEVEEINGRFAVIIRYPTGGVGYRWGFCTEEGAQAWIKSEQEADQKQP